MMPSDKLYYTFCSGCGLVWGTDVSDFFIKGKSLPLNICQVIGNTPKV